MKRLFFQQGEIGGFKKVRFLKKIKIRILQVNKTKKNAWNFIFRAHFPIGFPQSAYCPIIARKRQHLAIEWLKYRIRVKKEKCFDLFQKTSIGTC